MVFSRQRALEEQLSVSGKSGLVLFAPVYLLLYYIGSFHVLPYIYNQVLNAF